MEAELRAAFEASVDDLLSDLDPYDDPEIKDEAVLEEVRRLIPQIAGLADAEGLTRMPYINAFENSVDLFWPYGDKPFYGGLLVNVSRRACTYSSARVDETTAYSGSLS